MLDILIGEKLNSSIKSTYEALVNFNTEYIIKLITAQEAAGADYLDINTAMCENELDMMCKVIDLVIEHSSCGISIDSPSADVIAKTAEYIKNREFILNSVTLTERIDELIPVALKHDCKIIAMPITAFGISSSADERMNNADIIIDKFISHGIKRKKIIIDVVVEALLANYNSAEITFKTLRKFKEKYPDITTLCGISNISYGLPNRPAINAAFLATAIHNGTDCAIVDVNAVENQTAINIANMLNGDDEYCIEYINYMRNNSGKFSSYI